ncbi:nitrogen fixation protein NifE [Erwinia sp. CPCC 100877]|nr:nitrogen fixation protein NifE [Erwinia sp. CPCC 100877]
MMGLLKYRPPQSSRMGILWTLATIKEAALIEFGSMGHMVYADPLLKRAGVFKGCSRYTTHINEVDIAMGSVERIEKTLQYVLKEENPSAVFFLPSSIPEMIGSDLQAICKELQQLYPQVPLIAFDYGGFQYDFTKGIEQTLLTLAKELIDYKFQRTERLSYNLLGSCSDLYNFQADEAELDRLIQQTFTLSKNCSLSARGSISSIAHLGQAHLNIVVRHEGVAAAKWLQQEFGIPYVYGRPYGAIQTQAWLEKIAEILEVPADFTIFHTEVAELKLYKSMCQSRFAYQPDKKRSLLRWTFGCSFRY